MKNLVLIGCFLVFSGQLSHAQTFSEWFKQKATQKEYLINQIAALKVYSDYVQKGYKLSREGLNLIGNIKNGDLKQHIKYFLSLDEVNPKIKGLPHVKDILIVSEKILSLTDRGQQLLSREGMTFLSPNENQYGKKVFLSMKKACKEQMELFENVITDNILQLKDDERIVLIDEIYQELQQQHAFLKNFYDGLNQLLRSRKTELKELEMQRSIYNIKP